MKNEYSLKQAVDIAKKINKETDQTIIYETDNYIEQEALAQRFYNIPEKLQELSDKKSIELFGKNNMERNDQYMIKYAKEGTILKKIKDYYYKRDMIANNLTLVHISRHHKGFTMKPRIPDNKLVSDGTEDGKIKRICFAKSILGAYSAVAGGPAEEYYVHVPINPKKIIDTKEVAKYVPDAKCTGEVWIQDKVIFTEVVGKIITGNPYGIVDICDHKGEIHISYLYDYVFYPNNPDLKNNVLTLVKDFV